MTFIAVSTAVHEPEDLERAIERGERAVQNGAELIEWRIDALAQHDQPLRFVQQLVRHSAAPCIITCRPTWEGGEYQGDEETRVELFEALVHSDDRPRYIDLELKSLQTSERLQRLVRANVEGAGGDLATSFIVSTHDFDARPRDLLQRVEAMLNEPGCAVMKVAWHARSLRDNLEAFELLATRRKPMIALCMGQFGLMSRVLAPKFGGFLTFVTDVEAEVTAPGQPTLDELRNLYRFERINSKTKVYGVIGWPVHHSLSPKIHNAGFEAVGHQGVHLPMPIPPEYEHFKATVGAMIDAAVLDFRGASVTIPHKENLVRFVRERGGRIDDLAERIGAANTLVVGSAGGLECVNTDCPAAIETLCDGMGITRENLRSQKIAVLGAGGVARAVIIGLLDCGAAVTVFNRNRDRADLLVNDIKSRLTRANGATASLGVGGTQDLISGGFKVLINCTPVGMTGGSAPDESPLPPEVQLDETVTLFETVYTPTRTPLVQEAEARGARVIYGFDMFLKQAAMQFERWTAKPAPMRALQDAFTARTVSDPHPS